MKEEVLISELKHLLNSQGWKYIENELNQEIERLTNEILAEWWLDARNNEKQFTAYDLLRTERLLTKDIKELPSKLIDRLKPVEEIEYS